jgi:glucosamine--fructose-6-phosphate aminotransferase (isomerizing)
METLGKFPDSLLAGIAGQSGAIRRAADGLLEQRWAVEAIRRSAAGARSVVLTGMGGSYHACHPAVNLLASAGVPALHVDAGELLYFRRPMLRGGGVAVLVSQSGESAEVVRLAESLARAADHPVLVAVTNGIQNRLARVADHPLDTRAGAEEGPSTGTFGAAVVILAVLARVLAGDDVGTAIERVGAQAGAAARAVDRLVRDVGAQADYLAHWVLDRRVIAVLGRGPGLAAAGMGALTLKESGIFAEAMGTAEFRHGPIELAGPELAVVILATERATRRLDLRLAERLVRMGAAVVVISGDGEVPPGAHGIGVGDLDPTFAPVAALVPIQLLAWRLAGLGGRRPGEYLRAAKVTADE